VRSCVSRFSPNGSWPSQLLGLRSSFKWRLKVYFRYAIQGAGTGNEPGYCGRHDRVYDCGYVCLSIWTVEGFCANAKQQYSLNVAYTSTTDRIQVLLSWSPLARYTPLARNIKLQ